MAKVIDMQLMRYINLFERISGVSTTDCFNYGNTLFFAIPKSKMNRALGPRGSNIKKLSDTLRRKIKLIEMPSSDEGIKKFIENLISPIEVTNIELKEGELVISAPMQSRAMLIGRNRVREDELKEILNKLFKIKSLKIGQ